MLDRTDPETTIACCGDVDGRDLVDEVTVFVATVGHPAYEDCRAHLDAQNCRFRIDVIDHVAPLSAASQCMIDRCRTTFFVQVDEDMILEPHAVRTLYDYMVAAGEDAAMFAAPLHDEHSGCQIHGLKIFRHEFLRDHRFEDVEGCEVELLHRLATDGFAYVRTLPADDPDYDESSTYDCGYFFARRVEGEALQSPGPLGRHGTKWTPTMLYERYFTAEHKWQSGKYHLRWYPQCRDQLLKRLMREPTEEDFFAVMGILNGALSKDVPRGEKDYRQYEALPGLAEARELYRELTNAGNDDD